MKNLNPPGNLLVILPLSPVFSLYLFFFFFTFSLSLFLYLISPSSPCLFSLSSLRSFVLLVFPLFALLFSYVSRSDRDSFVSCLMVEVFFYLLDYHISHNQREREKKKEKEKTGKGRNKIKKRREGKARRKGK